MRNSLILGGARSGKSRRAQMLAESLSQRRIYIATAEALDEEMTERITRHRSDRGTGWETVESPLNIVVSIKKYTAPNQVVLVDCLTLWLSNLIFAKLDVDAESEALVLAISQVKGPVIFVSNEVGMGLVPETPLGREFRDAQGRLNQDMAAVCDHVEFIAAGLPLPLKG